jgi:hypothetical protein
MPQPRSALLFEDARASLSREARYRRLLVALGAPGLFMREDKVLEATFEIDVNPMWSVNTVVKSRHSVNLGAIEPRRQLCQFRNSRHAPSCHRQKNIPPGWRAFGSQQCSF